MPYFSTSIGDDIEVAIEFEVTGKHYPATQTDPEEFPELNIVHVLIDESDIANCLNDETLDKLTSECWEHLNND